MQSKDKTFSRRTLVRAVATGVALTAGVTAATARGKRQHSSVAYQDSPHGHERCEVCTSFLPPASAEPSWVRWVGRLGAIFTRARKRRRA